MLLLHLGLKFPFRFPSWKLFSTKMTYLEICRELLLCLDGFYIDCCNNYSSIYVLMAHSSFSFGRNPVHFVHVYF